MCKVLVLTTAKERVAGWGTDSIFSLRFLRLVYRSLGRHQCTRESTARAKAWPRDSGRDTRDTQGTQKAKSSAILAPL